MNGEEEEKVKKRGRLHHKGWRIVHNKTLLSLGYSAQMIGSVSHKWQRSDLVPMSKVIRG